MLEAQNGNPKAFISYTWKPEEHKNWVRDLATRLRVEDGIEVILDQWHTAPGDQLTHFMEQAVPRGRGLRRRSRQGGGARAAAHAARGRG